MTPEPARGPRRLALDGVDGPIAAGRAFTRETLDAWSWPPAADGAGQTTVAEVVLAVSELLTNAIRHGGGPVDLVLDLSGGTLRIQVADRDPALPRVREPHDPGVPGGHGLRIVEKVCDRWGVIPREGGKTVWLEISSADFA